MKTFLAFKQQSDNFISKYFKLKEKFVRMQMTRSCYGQLKGKFESECKRQASNRAVRQLWVQEEFFLYFLF